MGSPIGLHVLTMLSATGVTSLLTCGLGNDDDLSFRLEPLIGEVALKYPHTFADVSRAGLEVEEGTTVSDGELLYLFTARPILLFSYGIFLLHIFILFFLIFFYQLHFKNASIL